MTTEHAYNDFLNELNKIYERREAANISDWVFESVTGLKRLERSIQKSNELSSQVIEHLKKIKEELLSHKPVQYVLHEAWFYKRKFYVDEHVLIPRPETEELVEWIVDDIRNSDIQNQQCKIIDIGTGSGCIPISIKKELENTDVTAIDISEKALSVAKKNANLLHAEVRFLQNNFLDESLWNSLGVYDFIVSNPPYIPEAEKNNLAKNVSAFEPGIALFVRDNDPFIFYEKIAKFSQSHLASNGKVFVEIHEDYSGDVQQIFTKHDFKTQTRKDMYGKERMIKAILS